MSDEVKNLITKIRQTEEQLAMAVERRRANFSYRLEKRRVFFEDKMIQRHREMKQKLWSYVRNARPMVMITAPVIYSILIPFILLDIFVTIYQALCFPVYGIEKVRRSDHIVFDRHRLAYLNGIEKLNCTYCAYGNGLIAFVREVAARTERYWCPIKHAPRIATPHAYYWEFAEYGDADGYRNFIASDINISAE